MSLEKFVAQAQAETAELIRKRLRAQLLAQPPEWLAERLLEHTMSRLGLPVQPPEIPAQLPRRTSAHRPRALELDEAKLHQLISQYAPLDRVVLEAEDYLIDPPGKGGGLIGPEHRTTAGERVLAEAKDVLYALLACEPADGVTLPRNQRELLTVTMPKSKLPVFAFLGCAAAHDDRAQNALLQIEYGEAGNELVRNGIGTMLKLINNLEVNEQILYTRMEDVEQSTLI